MLRPESTGADRHNPPAAEPAAPMSRSRYPREISDLTSPRRRLHLRPAIRRFGQFNIAICLLPNCIRKQRFLYLNQRSHLRPRLFRENNRLLKPSLPPPPGALFSIADTSIPSDETNSPHPEKSPHSPAPATFGIHQQRLHRHASPRLASRASIRRSRSLSSKNSSTKIVARFTRARNCRCI